MQIFLSVNCVCFKIALINIYMKINFTCFSPFFTHFLQTRAMLYLKKIIDGLEGDIY